MEQIIQVRYFAGLRELSGTDNEEIEISGSINLDDFIEKIKIRHPELANELGTTAVSVNMDVADPASTTLKPGDEVAFLPPFGGG